MSDFRCPKHDRIFESSSDQRKPGALASPDGKLPAHPENGHPDCPLCQAEAKEKAKPAPGTVNSEQTGKRRIA